MFCVYITRYKGNLMPSQYIGSTSIDKIRLGYRGSVSSKKWKSVWDKELNEHPDLFETEIISEHRTREEALKEELILQLQYDVVRSSDWVNEGYAQPDGYAGRDVSGSNNPMFGKGHKMSEWCKNNPDKLKERNKKAAETQWKNPTTRSTKIAAMKGKHKSRKKLSEGEFLKMQREKAEVARQRRLIDIEYEGIIYKGWSELFTHTGITKHLYKKYYVNGIDPLLRKGCNGPAKPKPNNH